MHGITSMTHLPDYVTPQKAGESGWRAVWPTQAASSLAQQHTFQQNEKSLNWAFVELTYISTAEMYVNRCLQAHAARHSARKARAKRKKGRFRQPEPSPDAKGAPVHGRDPLQRKYNLLRQSPSYFAACLRAERTAASMALLVTVAPATPSMSALWASSTCLA